MLRNSFLFMSIFHFRRGEGRIICSFCGIYHVRVSCAATDGPGLNPKHPEALNTLMGQTWGQESGLSQAKFFARGLGFRGTTN